MLISGLREKFPDTVFIGEESVASGDKCHLTSGKTWIIDPIDGTTNFINSNPHICTILAFMVDKVTSSLLNKFLYCGCYRTSCSVLSTILFLINSGLARRVTVLSTMATR